MAGESIASVAFEFKDALFEAIKSVMAASDVPAADLLVCWGIPGPSYPTEVIAMIGTESTQVKAAIGAHTRSRTETLTAQIQIVVGRVGTWIAQREAERQAYKLLTLIENYCRSTDTTLGGVVQECFLTAHTCEGFTDPEQMAAGRVAELTATFTALARITNH